MPYEKPLVRPQKLDTNVSGKTEGALFGTRYGMPGMSSIMDEKRSQVKNMFEIEGTVPYIISVHYPSIVTPESAEVIRRATNKKYVNEHIDEILADIAKREAIKHHFEDCIFDRIRDDAGPEAARFVHIFLTSADSSETAKYLMCRDGLDELIPNLEYLRDACLFYAKEWTKYITTQSTHGADALPEHFGRRLATEARALQENINELYKNRKKHVVGKLSGATGNYHPMESVGINGPLIEKECCDKWDIRPAKASVQDPQREHLAYIITSLTITASTIASILKWVKYNRNTARGELREPPDEGMAGSSAMPQKDPNTFIEERCEGFSDDMVGNAVTILNGLIREDARTLRPSATDRRIIPEAFIAVDYGAALAVNVLERVVPQPDKINEGLHRSFDTTTSENIRYQLGINGMKDREARKLSGDLARQAVITKTPYREVLKGDARLREFLSEGEIDRFSNPINYTGRSMAIIEEAYDELFGKTDPIED